MFEKEAEEYTMKKICKNCTYRCYTENILKSNKLDCFSYARGYKIFKDGAEFGYNKANEWHDLRKNPNDLPDTDRNVWVKRESEVECQIDNYYEDDKGWGIMFREGYCTDDVILWCELPVPPKEIKENAELKEKLGDVQMQKAGEKSDLVWKLKTANEQKAEQLTKAKGIIEELYNIIPASMADYVKEPMEHARKFMTEE